MEPTKLARPADTSAFGTAAKGERLKAEGQNADLHTLPIHEAIQDYLDERGDPRGDLVRNRHPEGSLAADGEAFHASQGPDRFGAGAVGFHRFEDGTRLTLCRYRGKGGTHWHVQWNAEPGSSAFHGSYGVHMPHSVFKTWLKKFDRPDAEAIVKSYNKSVRAGQKPFKLAAMQAPAGGAITNNQFQQGGRFMPKALGRIRDVMARYVASRKGKLKLAAESAPRATFEHAFNQPDFGPMQESLTHEQLRKVEDFFQVPEKARLSQKAKIDDKTGQISASNQQVAKFIDHVSKAALGPSDVRRFLRNPDHEDSVKHAVQHLTHEAHAQRTREKEGSGQDWYAGELKHFDDTLAHLMGGEKAGWTKHHGSLAKVLLALTSGGQNPVLNTAATVRMLRAGMKRGGIHAIPENNEDALEKWKNTHPEAGDPPAEIADRIRWAHKHSGGSKDAPGWKALQALVAVGKTGVVPLAYYKGEERHDLHGAETGKKLGAAKRAGKLKIVDFPTPSADGSLIPKGWTNRNEQVVANLQKFKAILKHFDNDPKKTSDWLLAEHEPHEIEAVTGAPMEQGYVTDPVIPGTFALGPKFGPFALNLHIPQDQKYGKYLTADMWWARTWNRYFGSLFGQGAKKDGVAAPRNDRERGTMWKAAKEAAHGAGLSSVAELQAVLWYYEQRLWRLLGAKNKSYSYRHGIDAAKRNKLSRSK